MFSFFSKSIYLADILEGYHDLHSHLLPGVDDGSPALKNSLPLLESLEELGVKGMYFTPHIINGMYDNGGEELMRNTFSKFEYGGPIKINLAAEYFIDEKFPDHVNGNPLTFKGNYLLTEFEMNSYSIRSLDMLFEASLKGFNIIIAHPERYTFMQDDDGAKLLSVMINSQYKLQLNLLSLVGFHGELAYKLANKFLKDGIYTFAGTDTHSRKYIEAIKSGKIPAKTFELLKPLRENNATLF